MILKAKGLYKSYQESGDAKKVDVLRDFNMDLEKGQTLAIMGPSGCGKSTLISILGGLDRPDQGEVQIAGQNLYALGRNELTDFRAKNIGIVFQQFHLLPHLKAVDNVRLPLDLQGEDNTKDRALQALEAVGLLDRADHFPHQMSRGECQRTAIARVLVMQPEVILADEPTGSLDRRTADEVMELFFNKLKESKISLVLVTHDEEIARLCERRLDL